MVCARGIVAGAFAGILTEKHASGVLHHLGELVGVGVVYDDDRIAYMMDNTELHRTLRKYALDGIWVLSAVF